MTLKSFAQKAKGGKFLLRHILQVFHSEVLISPRMEEAFLSQDVAQIKPAGRLEREEESSTYFLQKSRQLSPKGPLSL